MPRYDAVNDYNELEIFLNEKMECSRPKMTFFIDHLLYNGGRIRDIHNTIIAEQEIRNSNRYRTKGFLFNNRGNVQQGTLFGHIAHLIFEEQFVIRFGELIIDRNSTEAQLNNLYENNDFIRVIGLNAA